MALDDYEESNYGVIGWKKISDENFLVTVEETSRYRDRGFIVKIIDNGRRIKISKKFRNIPEATRFANGYMESHK